MTAGSDDKSPPSPAPVPPPAPLRASSAGAAGRRPLHHHLTRTLGGAAQSLVEMLLPRPPHQAKEHPGATPGMEHDELHRLAQTQPTTQPARVTCIDYGPDQAQTQEITHLDEFLSAHRPAWCAVRWINVDGLGDLKVIHDLAAKYHLHPLAVEDVLSVPQRPKVDDYAGDEQYQARLFIVTRMIQWQDDRLHAEQISIFLGHHTVLTIQETPGDVWDPIRQRLSVKGSRLRQSDASFLMYALLDAIVDHCFPILEVYGDRLQDLEEMIVSNPTEGTVQHLHELSRELMLLRRQVWPMRDMIQALQRDDYECLGEQARLYLRDVADHLAQVIDMIETYRDIGANVLDAYATFMGNKLNEVVKVLTVVTVIFTPPMFLASVYGMNFPREYFPELNWALGYPMFWALSVGSSAAMWWWFRRRKWL